MTTSTRILCLLAGLVLFRDVNQAQSLYFPPAGETWETIDPVADLNWCPEKLDSLHDYLGEKNTKAFMILKGGRIAVEWYYDDFTQDSLWYWASAGKSLTSTLVGIARQNGYLDLDDPTSDYLGQGWTACSPEQESAITVRHQLTMTSGLDDKTGDADCTDPACLLYLADPGTRWAYHNAPYTLLDGVISAATGTSINQFFAKELGTKIGAVGLYLKVGYNNVFFSRIRDMARFGLLILGKGTWDGTPVLSDTTYYNLMVNSSQSLNPSYGYLWWLNGKGKHMIPGLQLVFNQDIIPSAPDDLFAALGKNDQKVYIVPSQDLVVVRMGNSAGLVLPALSAFDTPLWEQISDLPCTTGTEPDPGPITLRIWPNPVTGMARIDGWTDGSTWTLYRRDGISARQGNQAVLDVHGLVSGLYWLRVRDGDGRVTVHPLQIR